MIKTNTLKQRPGIIVAHHKDPDEAGLEYGLIQVKGCLELFVCQHEHGKSVARVRLGQKTARWMMPHLKTFAKTGKLE